MCPATICRNSSRVHACSAALRATILGDRSEIDREPLRRLVDEGSLERLRRQRRAVGHRARQATIAGAGGCRSSLVPERAAPFRRSPAPVLSTAGASSRKRPALLAIGDVGAQQRIELRDVVRVQGGVAHENLGDRPDDARQLALDRGERRLVPCGRQRRHVIADRKVDERRLRRRQIDARRAGRDGMQRRKKAAGALKPSSRALSRAPSSRPRRSPAATAAARPSSAGGGLRCRSGRRSFRPTP